jgi:hypothetical protein
VDDGRRSRNISCTYQLAELREEKSVYIALTDPTTGGTQSVDDVADPILSGRADSLFILW